MDCHAQEDLTRQPVGFEVIPMFVANKRVRRIGTCHSGHFARRRADGLDHKSPAPLS
jgi:hypothetical protein